MHHVLIQLQHNTTMYNGEEEECEMKMILELTVVKIYKI